MKSKGSLIGQLPESPCSSRPINYGGWKENKRTQRAARLAWNAIHLDIEALPDSRIKACGDDGGVMRGDRLLNFGFRAVPQAESPRMPSSAAKRLK